MSQYAIDSETILLLHNNISPAVDTTGLNTITMNASSIINFDTPKFGEGYLRLPSATADTVDVDGQDFSMSGSSGDKVWTIDFWFRTTSVTQDYANILNVTGVGNGQFQMNLHQGTIHLPYLGVFPTGWQQIYSSATGMTTNIWYHLEVAFNGTQIYFFVNGVLKGNPTLSVTPGFGGGDLTNLQFGGANAFAPTIDFDEFRFSRVVRHTSNFTPPTREYSDHFIKGRVLLDTSGVSGATVRLICQDTDSYIGDSLTNSTGDYSFIGLDDTYKYHAAVEYQSGANQYNSQSYWDISPGYSIGKIIRSPYDILATSIPDSYTIFLLHADGTDQSTNFIDSSQSGRTVTATGVAQIDTDLTDAFGGNSGVLQVISGVGSLTMTDSSSFNLGTGDFTLDCWVYLTTLAASGYRQLILRRGSGQILGYYSIGLFNNSGTHQLEFSAYNGSWVSAAVNYTPSTGQWFHLACVRTSSQIKFFIDGSQVGSDVSASWDISGVTTGVWVSSSDTYQNFTGYLDEIRLSLGIARWTSNFTPPTTAY